MGRVAEGESVKGNQGPRHSISGTSPGQKGLRPSILAHGGVGLAGPRNGTGMFSRKRQPVAITHRTL